MHNNEFITTGTQFASLDRKKKDGKREDMSCTEPGQFVIQQPNFSHKQELRKDQREPFFFSSQYCPRGIQ